MDKLSDSNRNTIKYNIKTKSEIKIIYEIV